MVWRVTHKCGIEERSVLVEADGATEAVIKALREGEIVLGDGDTLAVQLLVEGEDKVR